MAFVIISSLFVLNERKDGFMPPKLANNQKSSLLDKHSSQPSPLPQQVSDSLRPESKPISAPDTHAIQKAFNLLDIYFAQQVANAATIADSEMYCKSINNFCLDARVIMQYVCSPADQRARLISCAKGYFNKQHSMGELFYKATLRAIDRLTGSVEELLLPTATRVSAAALINQRTKNKGFLSSSQPEITESRALLPDSTASISL